MATLHHVFRRLDVDAFEWALGDCAQECLGEGGAVIAIDGKALRGMCGKKLPGVWLVAVYAGESGLVVGQKGRGIVRRANLGWPPVCWGSRNDPIMRTTAGINKIAAHRHGARADRFADQGNRVLIVFLEMC